MASWSTLFGGTDDLNIVVVLWFLVEFDGMFWMRGSAGSSHCDVVAYVCSVGAGEGVMKRKVIEMIKVIVMLMTVVMMVVVNGNGFDHGYIVLVHAVFCDRGFDVGR